MKLADGAVKESLTEILKQHYVKNRSLDIFYCLAKDMEIMNIMI